LTRYRLALDADADPVAVSGWMREVQGQRLAAEAELDRCVPGEPMTKDQVRKLIGAMQDLTKVLEEADPKLQAEVYAELGISVRYDPALRIVHVEA
jgi:hypothetical protein